jgi:DNA-binding SARP family transcriptional activator
MDGGRSVPITAGRDRIVLAMLLLSPNRTVRGDQLIEAVWGETPPATARGQLQTCVSRLRRSLPGVVIETHPDGYAISLADADLDLTAYANLVGEAATAADADRYRQALDLWRGPALAGLDSQLVRAAAAGLDEQYSATVEDWVELELSRGRERDLVAELTGLVQRFPLRERLRGQLMLTLYRLGRQADALAEYRRARDVLRAELGVEPSAELGTLHQRLLSGEIAVPAHPSGTVSALPRSVDDFTGRGELIARILSHAGSAPHIEVLDGMPGSGKTTVAVHAAGLLRDRYPDAQLFLDLQGHSEQAPIEPSAAVTTLLRQLGFPATGIPDDVDERFQLWRGELASRRTVLVLDNAAGSAQVMPLLPASGAVFVLITSRRRLVGLDGVRPESLDVLGENEAIGLLAAIAGDRVGAEPLAARDVVRSCGLLPLAIRLAGSRLAHRPRWRVADLARRLGESALPELAAEERTVAAAFALSYGQLDAGARRMFRLVGLHPGERLDALSAAALAGLPLVEAEDLLDALVDVHLVQEPEAGRYRLHDLLRAYANALTTPGSEPAAMERLLNFQLHALLANHAENDRGRIQALLKQGPPDRPDLLERLGDAGLRFDRERANLVPLVEAAAGTAQPGYAWWIARAAWTKLWVLGYVDDIEAVFGRAWAAAKEAGDDAAAVMSGRLLASASMRHGDIERSRELVEECLELSRKIGDPRGLALSTSSLGVLAEVSGRLDEALALFREGIALTYRAVPAARVGVSLNAIAEVLDQLGRPAEALQYARRGLFESIQSGGSYELCTSFLLVAEMRAATGGGDRITRRQLAAMLRLARRHGHRVEEVKAIDGLALISRRAGDLAGAIAGHRSALAIVEEMRERLGLPPMLNNLGLALTAAGETAEAIELHRRALRIAEEIKRPYQQARSHLFLARSLSGYESAHHAQRAREIFASMNVPSDQLRIGFPRGTMDA